MDTTQALAANAAIISPANIFVTALTSGLNRKHAEKLQSTQLQANSDKYMQSCQAELVRRELVELQQASTLLTQVAEDFSHSTRVLFFNLEKGLESIRFLQSNDIRNGHVLGHADINTLEFNTLTKETVPESFKSIQEKISDLMASARKFLVN